MQFSDALPASLIRYLLYHIKFRERKIPNSLPHALRPRTYIQHKSFGTWKPLKKAINCSINSKMISDRAILVQLVRPRLISLYIVICRDCLSTMEFKQ